MSTMKNHLLHSLARAGLMVGCLATVAAWGATSPLVVWNNDLSNGSSRNGFTMSFGSNAAAVDGTAELTAKTSGSEIFKGVAIDWENATFSGQTMTVLVKYSGFAQTGLTGNTALVGTYWGSSNKSSETLINASKTQVKAAYNVTSSNSGSNTNFWTRTLPSDGLLRVTFSSSGTHFTFLTGVEGAWTKGSNLDIISTNVEGLKKSASFYGLRIGGSISKISSYYRPGMTVSAVSILDTDISDDDLLAYTFPKPYATWTNAKKDNDIENAGNWLDGVSPYDGGTITSNILLAADADWSTASISSLNSKIVDLRGHALTVSSISGSGTVTDLSSDGTKPGTFAVTVAEGTTWKNSGVALTGNLKLVKQGAGTFIGGVQYQTYTGGTYIDAGIVKSNASESDMYYGAEGSAVTINAGGTLEINGKYDWYCHPIILNGGIVSNTGAHQTSYTSDALGSITMQADSTLKIGLHTLINHAGSTVDLGGHTLTVEFIPNIGDGKAQLVINQATLKNGTLVCGNNIVLYPYSTNCKTEDLSIVNNGDFRFSNDLTLRDFTDASQGLYQTVGKTAFVTGRYKPASEYLLNVNLLDGATLDLTGKTTTWQFANAKATSETMSFASGATITVDVSDRVSTLVRKEKVIAWELETLPAATFEWDDTTAARAIPVYVTTDGLYFGADDSAVVSATWTNASGNGKLSDPKNWTCYNADGNVVEGAVPGENTAVTINGSQPIQIKAAVSWGGLSLNGSLTGDMDWTGLTTVKFTAASTFDLNGHTFTINALDNSSSPVSISDYYVETKPGAFVLMSGTTKVWSGFTTEAGVRIKVGGAATLNLNGINNTIFKAVLSDGATLANTGSVIDTTNVPVIGGGLELEEGATATINMSNRVQLRAKSNAVYPMALNGGTLIKAGAKLGIINGDITGPGTIKVTGAEFNIGSVGIRIDDDVVIDVVSGGPYTWTQGASTVPTIIGNGIVGGSTYPYTITKRLSGRLRIDAKSVTLVTGATLDLSGNTGVYAIPSKVSLADSASICIDLTGRADIQAGDRVVSWTTEPPQTVRFFAVGAPYVIDRRDDGLYLVSAEGLSIGVR